MGRIYPLHDLKWVVGMCGHGRNTTINLCLHEVCGPFWKAEWCQPVFPEQKKYLLVLFLLLWVLFPTLKGVFLKHFCCGVCWECAVRVCWSWSSAVVFFSRNMQHGSSHGNWTAGPGNLWDCRSWGAGPQGGAAKTGTFLCREAFLEPASETAHRYTEVSWIHDGKSSSWLHICEEKWSRRTSFRQDLLSGWAGCDSVTAGLFGIDCSSWVFWQLNQKGFQATLAGQKSWLWS